VHRQTKLLQLVLALSPAGCLASLLHGGQQQGNQNGNDGNDDKQLNQCKRSARLTPPVSSFHRETPAASSNEKKKRNSQQQTVRGPASASSHAAPPTGRHRHMASVSLIRVSLAGK
jgi:hypothetical protein